MKITHLHLHVATNCITKTIALLCPKAIWKTSMVHRQSWTKPAVTYAKLFTYVNFYR